MLSAGLSTDRYAVNLYVRNVGDKRVYFLNRLLHTDSDTAAVYGIAGHVLQLRILAFSWK